jgi:hypothetical protein
MVHQFEDRNDSKKEARRKSNNHQTKEEKNAGSEN